MSADEAGHARYARVGTRFHLLSSEPSYVGQPEVALCGTVFVRMTEQPEDAPLCFDCHRREVDRLHHLAAQLLDEANEKALSLSRTPHQDPA